MMFDQIWLARCLVYFLITWSVLARRNIQIPFGKISPVEVGSGENIAFSEEWQLLGPFQIGTRGMTCTSRMSPMHS